MTEDAALAAVRPTVAGRYDEPEMTALDPSQAEAVTLFRDLLRLDTTNPPGNERLAVDCVASHLADRGIEPFVVESGPGRASLIARLPARAPGGATGGPLMLTAHLDVVPAGDPARWAHPAFSATLDDGYIYGRGAVDMKHMAALSVQVLVDLFRRQARLSRDLIVTLVADEEDGCDFGSRYLVEHHPERVRAEYALGEVGGFTLHLGEARFYPVMVAEKGLAWLRLRARGEPGHGSMPNRDSAVVRLARAVARIGAARLPQHTTPVVAGFIRALAARQPLVQSLVLKGLLSPATAGLILERVFPDPALARPFLAALSNTASPTVLQAGTKTNVIPGQAEALLDGRTLPGQTTQDLIFELKTILGDEADGLEWEVLREAPPVESRAETPLFDVIRQAIAEHDPGAVAVPYMIPGFTDAKAFSRLGTTCYGFSPVRLPPGLNFSQLYHGDNERIPLDGVVWGLRVLGDVVERFCR